MRGPKVHSQRSSHMDSHRNTATIPNMTQLHPESPLSTENMSATSGTTLARALIANSFILSDDARTSRYRSGTSTGTARQDSATLPPGEYPFLNSPYWRDKRISGGDIILSPQSGRNSVVPPVPRIPSITSLRLKRSKSARSSAAIASIQEKDGRRSGTDLSRRASSSSLRSPRLSGSGLIPRTRPSSLSGTNDRPASHRISLIEEVSSPAPSTPSTSYQGDTKSPNNRGVVRPGSSPLAKTQHSDKKTP